MLLRVELLSSGSHGRSSSVGESESVVTQCPTLCDPMDCSPPGSSVRGILQARVLEWDAMPSSRGSSQPREAPGFPAGQTDSSPSDPPGSFSTHLTLPLSLWHSFWEAQSQICSYSWNRLCSYSLCLISLPSSLHSYPGSSLLASLFSVKAKCAALDNFCKML